MRTRLTIMGIVLAAATGLVGIVVLIVFLASEPTPGANQYGVTDAGP